MKTKHAYICVPWTKLLRYRCIFILAYCLSWITKPCTQVFHKYKLAKSLSRSSKIYLVLQPGKVASRSVISFLKSAGVQEPVFHLHYISETQVALEQHGPLGRYLLFPQISSYDFLSKSLKTFAMNGGEINIVCGVRDPWSRCRSAFLQNLDSILLYDSKNTFIRSPNKISLSSGELRDLFINKFNFKFNITWFDQVLLPLTGINVFQYPFPIDKGSLCISKENFNIFLYRFDQIENCQISKMLNCFLGPSFQTTQMLIVNEVSAEKQPLKTLIESLEIPDSISAYFASSQLARHFFSAEEITKFISNK